MFDLVLVTRHSIMPSGYIGGGMDTDEKTLKIKVFFKMVVKHGTELAPAYEDL